jgi:uncharacterized membrane protein YqjE
MAATPPVERVPEPGLFNTLRSFVGVLLATLCTRADLATVELEEQAIFAARLVIAGLVALLCFSTAFFFFMLWIVAIFWAEKVLALGIIVGVYLLIGLTGVAISRTMLGNRPKLLEHTLAELRKDVDGLRKPIITTTEAGK